VKSVVKAGLEPHVTRGMPALTIAYSTTSFGRVAIDGLHDVLGEAALVFGLGTTGPEGFTPTPTNMPAVFAIEGGQPYQPSRVGCGMAAALCWPSVHFAGAFSPASCLCERQNGTVTSIRETPTLISAPEGYAAEASSQRELPSDVVIETIHGRHVMDGYPYPYPEPRTRTR